MYVRTYLWKGVPDGGGDRHFSQDVFVDWFGSFEHLIDEFTLMQQSLSFYLRETNSRNSGRRQPPPHALSSAPASSFSSTPHLRVPKLSIHHWFKCFLVVSEIRKGDQIWIFWVVLSRGKKRTPTMSIESSFRSAGRFMWMSARAFGVIICTESSEFNNNAIASCLSMDRGERIPLMSGHSHHFV